MEKNLHSYRKSYEKANLSDQSLLDNPYDQFEQWFSIADTSELVEEANAMMLSTVDSSGMPRGRIVLLKEITHKGFVFYSNYNSDKGKAINENNKVCISFFWPGLERQIIIQGEAFKVSEEKSANYFNKRPRESQLGALASNQSQEIASRETLEEKLTALKERYADKPIPKPEDWGGYMITPLVFEFWQGRSSRLHDRIQYKLTKTGWNRKRLQP